MILKLHNFFAGLNFTGARFLQAVTLPQYRFGIVGMSPKLTLCFCPFRVQHSQQWLGAVSQGFDSSSDLSTNKAASIFVHLDTSFNPSELLDGSGPAAFVRSDAPLYCFYFVCIQCQSPHRMGCVTREQFEKKLYFDMHSRIFQLLLEINTFICFAKLYYNKYLLIFY